MARMSVRRTRRLAGALTPARAALAALAVAQVASGRKVPSPPRVTRAIAGLMLAASAAEAVESARTWRGALPLAGAGGVGFAVELAGVATGRPFGRYAYSERLGPRLAGVPLLAAGAWAMMARPAWAVAGRLSRRAAARVPLAAGALTAWDVFLDPRMVREGYWSWPGGGRYEGVPASNFGGWLVTGTAAFAAYAALEPRAQGRDGGAVALYVWTWVAETVANVAIWRRPRVAAAGALAMGAFAAPALGRPR
jgi:uncharacterized membrane protein